MSEFDFDSDYQPTPGPSNLENKILKDQVKDAVKVAKSVDTLHSANTKYQKDVALLKSKVDDLERKLMLKAQENEDLRHKLNIANEQLQRQKQLFDELSKKETSKFNEVNRQNIEEIDKLNKLINTLKNRNVSYQSDLEEFLNEASEKLGNEFTSLNDLIPFLKVAPPPASPLSADEKAKLKKYSDIKKTLKKTTTKLTYLADKLDQVMNENSELRSTIEKLENEAEKEKQRNEEVIQFERTKHIHRVEEMEKKLREVNDSKIKTESQFSTLTQKLQESELEPVAELRDLNLSPEKEDASTPLKSGMEKLYQQATQENQKLRRENAKVHRENDDLRSQVQTSLLLVNENLEEINNLRDSIAKKREIETAPDETEKENFKKKISILKEKIVELNKENDNLLQEKKDNELKADDSEAKVRGLTGELKTAENEIQRLEREIKNLQTELQNRSISESFPENAWRYANFPAELKDKVQRIVTNKNVPAETKTSAALREINDFFNDKLNSANDDAAKNKKALKDIRECIESFLHDLGIAVIGSGSSVQNILEGEDEKILDSIKKLKSGKSGLEAQLNKIKKDIQNLLDFLKIPGDSSNFVEEIKNLFEALNAKNNDHLKRIKKLEAKLNEALKEQDILRKAPSNEVKKIKKLKQMEISSLKEEIQKLKQEQAELEDKNTQLQSEMDIPVTRDVDNSFADALSKQVDNNNKLKKQNHDLVDELKKLHYINKKLEEQVKDLNEVLLTHSEQASDVAFKSNDYSQNEVVSTAMKQLRDQNAFYQQQYNDLLDKNKELNSKAQDFPKLKKDLEKLKKLKEELEKEIKMLKEALEREKEICRKKIIENELNLASQLDKQIKEAEKMHEKTIKDLYEFACKKFQTYPKRSDTPLNTHEIQVLIDNYVREHSPSY